MFRCCLKKFSVIFFHLPSAQLRLFLVSKGIYRSSTKHLFFTLCDSCVMAFEWTHPCTNPVVWQEILAILFIALYSFTLLHYLDLFWGVFVLWVCFSFPPYTTAQQFSFEKKSQLLLTSASSLLLLSSLHLWIPLRLFCFYFLWSSMVSIHHHLFSHSCWFVESVERGKCLSTVWNRFESQNCCFKSKDCTASGGDIFPFKMVISVSARGTARESDLLRLLGSFRWMDCARTIRK